MVLHTCMASLMDWANTSAKIGAFKFVLPWLLLLCLRRGMREMGSDIPQCPCGSQRVNFQGSILSFQDVGPGDQTGAVSFGSRRLYSLSHLASPRCSFNVPNKLSHEPNVGTSHLPSKTSPGIMQEARAPFELLKSPFKGPVSTPSPGGRLFESPSSPVSNSHFSTP